MSSSSPTGRGRQRAQVDGGDDAQAPPAAPRKRVTKSTASPAKAAVNAPEARPARPPARSRRLVAVESPSSVAPAYPEDPAEVEAPVAAAEPEPAARPEPSARRRRALVTGATSGIGLELARLLARDGYDLVLVARGRAALDRVAAELRAAFGVEVDVVAADLSDPKAPGTVAQHVRKRGETLDVLVNNAGYGVFGAFADTALDDELGMLRLNINAVTALTKLLLPAVMASRGRILNVASTAAFQPGPFMATYYASKAYVLHFSEALATELDGTGVTVTALCPGVVPTGFQDRAGVGSIRLVKAPGALPAATVARKAYRGMMRGRRVVVPGGLNKLTVQSLRVAPRRLVTSVVRRLHAG